MKNPQFMSLCCVLLAVAISSMAQPDETQYSENISNMVPSVIKDWQKLRVEYSKMLAQNIKETFVREKRGDMNTFSKFSRLTEEELIISPIFYTKDPQVHLLFRNLNVTLPPDLDVLSLDIEIPGNALTFTSKLTDIHFASRYRLFRIRGDKVVNDSQSADGLSPFMLKKIHEVGVSTIIADRCTFQGILLLVPSEQTFAVANSNYNVSECNFQIEVLPKTNKGNASISNTLLGKKSLIAQWLATFFEYKAKAAIVSTVNTTHLFSSDYQKQFGYAYSFFNTYIGKLWSELLDSINDEGKAKTVNLDDMDFKNVFSLIFTMKNGKATNLQLHGLNTAYSSRTGTVTKCGDCSKILLVEGIRFNRLQVTGDINEKDYNSTFTVEMKDVKVLVALVENVKRKTKSLYSTEVTGFRYMEVLYTNKALKINERWKISISINGHIARIIPAYITRYITKNIPAALDKRNEAPIADDDTLRQLLIAMFGNLE